ncbi:GNAT family N-acetyltransferase [Metabacillus sp. HB246100]
MVISYFSYDSIPDEAVLDGIIQLHKAIFNSSDDVKNKMDAKSNVIVLTAMKNSKVIGYKIGYELTPHMFYSWLGGVDPTYRKNGIASQLMSRQHSLLKEKGYRVVQTKSMNKWRSMLLLNIQNGFDVIDTYVDEKGLHKITLEKTLDNER